MNNFQYKRVSSPAAAIAELSKDPAAKLVAGGTNLIDLMKYGVMAPDKLVDVNHLSFDAIKKEERSLYIGATVRNAVAAGNADVLKYQPLLSQAMLAGASAQLRNKATMGGNLLQRTRCGYFYDISAPCNKRVPGSGCAALEGYNRMHAIFGASSSCIAVNPSDMNVALTALDATILVSGPKGDRKIPVSEFHRLPGTHPELDTTLDRKEIITGLVIPDNNFAAHTTYLKVRDRISYAFALISVAVAIDLDGTAIRDIRLAMGGVAHKPWRLTEAEQLLKGKQATVENFKMAAELAMKGAKAYEHNAFKLKLAPNTMIQALKTASGVKA
ncbi:xanthine dehydrogenase YagS FAD-binding subunit [Pedobacter westerhofensis]|uniref:Xanthine dehydrogenase YagS FAD-binding subunit n=1 Tax=Pedobacter westerhofensis TaxID=425512 RepID=A0A521BIR5_9SPHI|nr:xanthine dehydrogenase family protein subunit M [Pedobacter westerhofensis]SMO46985.1 xanthine dehydrogenase YagS FAD-binding subunit [Pedobacter westerhofensis]